MLIDILCLLFSLQLARLHQIETRLHGKTIDASTSIDGPILRGERPEAYREVVSRDVTIRSGHILTFAVINVMTFININYGNIAIACVFSIIRTF